MLLQAILNGRVYLPSEDYKFEGDLDGIKKGIEEKADYVYWR